MFDTNSPSEVTNSAPVTHLKLVELKFLLIQHIDITTKVLLVVHLYVLQGLAKDVPKEQVTQWFRTFVHSLNNFLTDMGR